MTVNSVISTSSDETLPARNADMFPGRPGRTLVPSSPDLGPSRRAVSKYLVSAPSRVVFRPRRSSPRFLSSRRLLRLGSAASGPRSRPLGPARLPPGTRLRGTLLLGRCGHGNVGADARPCHRAFAPPLGPTKACAGPVASSATPEPAPGLGVIFLFTRDAFVLMNMVSPSSRR